MSNYTLSKEALTAYHTLHNYWTEHYPTASLVVSNTSQVLDENGLRNVVFIGTPTTRANINDFLTDCLMSQRLSPIDYSVEGIEDFLPVQRSIGNGRQMELYAEVGKRILNRPMEQSLNECIAQFSRLAHIEPRRLAKTSEQAVKLSVAIGGTKAYQRISPRSIFRLSERDFRRLIIGVEEASNGFSAFSEEDDVTLE